MRRFVSTPKKLRSFIMVASNWIDAILIYFVVWGTIMSGSLLYFNSASKVNFHVSKSKEMSRYSKLPEFASPQLQWQNIGKREEDHHVAETVVRVHSKDV